MARGGLRFVGFVALVALAAGACSTSNDAVVAGPTARFKLSGDAAPGIMDVPFPTDAYLANGKVIDPIPGVDALMPRNAQYLTHELGKLDGFGRATFSFFYVDEPGKPLDDNGNPVAADIDPVSLPANEDACVADASSVFLIDLAPTDPSKSRIRCRGKIHDDSTHSTARPVVKDDSRHLLTGRGAESPAMACRRGWRRWRQTRPKDTVPKIPANSAAARKNRVSRQESREDGVFIRLL